MALGFKTKLSSALAAVIIVGAASTVGYRWNQTQSENQQWSHFQPLMALTASGGNTAPNFSLTDQNGKTISLSSYEGKNVVLEFMDPECTDICPVVSHETILANQNLGTTADDTVFLAINVNQYHESTKDALAFSKAHGLAKLNSWHFLTGSTKDLKAAWKAYGITVIPNPTGDVEHSSFIYFIDKEGHEQYIANPDHAKASEVEWGQGIAFAVRKMA